MENANRLEAAIPLAIKVAAQPHNEHKLIPRKPMIAKDKLAVEGGLAEKNSWLEFQFQDTYHDPPGT
jgi:hypothetical protein